MRQTSVSCQRCTVHQVCVRVCACAHTRFADIHSSHLTTISAATGTWKSILKERLFLFLWGPSVFYLKTLWGDIFFQCIHLFSMVQLSWHHIDRTCGDFTPPARAWVREDEGWVRGSERWLAFDVTIMQAYEIINTQEQTDLKQGRRGGGKRNDAGESSWCGWTDESKLLWTHLHVSSDVLINSISFSILISLAGASLMLIQKWLKRHNPLFLTCAHNGEEGEERREERAGRETSKESRDGW